MRMTRNIGRAAMLMAVALAFATAAHAQAPRTTPPTTTSPPQGQQGGPDAMFNRWDKDKNKALSLDEFKAGWNEVQAAMALRKLRENFVAMDASKNGSLEEGEYAKLELVKRAGKSAPQMSKFDTDKNQGLGFQEYVAMVQAMVGTRR